MRDRMTNTAAGRSRAEWYRQWHTPFINQYRRMFYAQIEAMDPNVRAMIPAAQMVYDEIKRGER